MADDRHWYDSIGFFKTALGYRDMTIWEATACLNLHRSTVSLESQLTHGTSRCTTLFLTANDVGNSHPHAFPVKARQYLSEQLQKAGR